MTEAEAMKEIVTIWIIVVIIVVLIADCFDDREWK